MSEPQRLFNVRQLSRHLSVSQKWLRLEVEENRLPCIRIRKNEMLFDAETVETILAERAKLGDGRVVTNYFTPAVPARHVGGVHRKAIQLFGDLLAVTWDCNHPARAESVRALLSEIGIDVNVTMSGELSQKTLEWLVAQCPAWPVDAQWAPPSRTPRPTQEAIDAAAPLNGKDSDAPSSPIAY